MRGLQTPHTEKLNDYVSQSFGTSHAIDWGMATHNDNARRSYPFAPLSDVFDRWGFYADAPVQPTRYNARIEGNRVGWTHPGDAGRSRVFRNRTWVELDGLYLPHRVACAMRITVWPSECFPSGAPVEHTAYRLARMNRQQMDVNEAITVNARQV